MSAQPVSTNSPSETELLETMRKELVWINSEVWPLVHGLTSREVVKDRFKRLPELINTFAAPSTAQTIGIQEVWEAAGGNPGIKATRDELLEALQAMDEAIDAADGRPIALAWSHEDSAAATDEGWDVFDSSERGLEIERIDVPEDAAGELNEPVFASDDAAIGHVYARAQDGSALHQKALLLTLTRMKDFAWPIASASAPADPGDPSVAVATPAAPAFGAEWKISANLTDRWGEINNADAHRKPLAQLESTPGLLERLRTQMFDEITFVARKDGTFGVLFEVEYTSIESDGENPDAMDLLPYDEMVRRLLTQADQLSREFPQVEFAVPNDREVFEGRPAIWGFAPDGVLNPEQRDALGHKLLTFAYSPDPQSEPEQDGGMRP